jgi:membrane fusion protein (multidrug efflux system)
VLQHLRARHGLILAFLVAALGACNGQSGAPPEPAAAPPPAVTVAAVERREINPSSSFTGRIEAVDTVDLRARVEGFLEQRLFQEGQEVAAGDSLFVIEKAPYKAKVAEGEATIVSAKATLKTATQELDRQASLAKKKLVVQSEVDLAAANAESARGELMAQQASLQKAELDLGYTDIVAPLAGKIGRSLFSVGNFVGPSSGTLATLVSQDPMYVTFPVTQRQLLEVRRQAAEKGEDPRDVTVKVRLADGNTYEQVGSIIFVDVQVNPNTDTVVVRASLPNPDRVLIDGQLVTAIVAQTTPESVLMVPEQAIQLDQAGSFALMVGEGDKVEVRRVVTAPGEAGWVAVSEGLAEGDRVIVEGIQKVRAGQVVGPAGATTSTGTPGGAHGLRPHQ